MTSRLDVNRHVREYLAYYLSFSEPPGYAVLVDGPWGVGKTHLVTRVLGDTLTPSAVQATMMGVTRTLPAEKPKYVYVSLFGLDSATEIDLAVFQAVYPMLGTKGAKVVSELGRTALRIFNAEPAMRVTELLNKFEAEVYVFDDLERCGMSVNAVFGYINEFVEHGKRKVIVIVNETEISDAENYARRREKLVGKTLQVQLALPEVANYFFSKLRSDDAKRLCAEHSELMRGVFLQSGLQNLRILQQSLWDFERLVPALTLKQIEHADGMAVLLRLFFAFSFEIKSGRLVAEDLDNRMDKIIAGSMQARDGKPTTRLFLADKIYADVNLFDTILSDAVLKDMLVKGLVDPVAIQEALSASAYFADGEEAPWRVVWHAFERSDEEFATAFKEMERQFEGGEFVVPGEILHVFGIRLWLSEIGIFTRSRVDIVEECKAYVDRLYQAGKLEPLPIDTSFDDFHFDGFGGLGIHESTTGDFRMLFEYLQSNRVRSKEDNFPTLADELLSEMQRDPRLYVRRLCWSNSGDSKFTHVPLLASVDPARFVSLVLSQPMLNQRIIWSAFKSRYEGGMFHRELAPEGSWLVAVRDQLLDQTSAAPPIGKWRVQRFINWYFSPALRELEGAPVAPPN